MADTNPGIAVLILTPSQRRDLVAALTEAIDAVEPLSDESPSVDRWVTLINLIEESAS